jgi:hypothetical protein
MVHGRFTLVVVVVVLPVPRQEGVFTSVVLVPFRNPAGTTR